MPDLARGTGPLYLRLADQIEEDIERRVLPAGTKLPPQRNLAFDIGVTIGTVSRAYAVARERGLVSGEVGRGTYVVDRAQGALAHPGYASPPGDFGGTREMDAPAGKLRFDSTAAPSVGQGEIIGTIVAGIMSSHAHDVASYARLFPDHWFEAGSQWLAKGRFQPPPERIVPTLGAHAGVVAIIAAMTSPGDHVAFEHLTYSHVARSAGLIGRRVTLIQSDALGVVPEDFERLCAQRHPKLAFLMPSAHNPTTNTMPAERRQAIAEIARRHNVWLVEDNLYGAMADDDHPLMAELAPERTFLVGGLSKSVVAGVRGGWISCPSHLERRVRISHRMVTGGLPFLLAETSARLVLSGKAAEIQRRCKDEINARLALARDALTGFNAQWRPNIPFIWLELPDPWLSSTFKQAASDRGVLIDDADEFKAGRSEQVFHHVRLGISAAPRREDLSKGLATIRRLLEEGSAGYTSYD